MLAFAAAVSIGEPPTYPIIEAPLAIAIFVTTLVLAYWFGSRNSPTWFKILVGFVWLISLVLFAGLFIGPGQCSWDDPLHKAQQNWIGVPAFALAVACPLFLARTFTVKHLYALLVALCVVLISGAVVAGIAIILPRYECAVA